LLLPGAPSSTGLPLFLHVSSQRQHLTRRSYRRSLLLWLVYRRGLRLLHTIDPIDISYSLTHRSYRRFFSYSCRSYRQHRRSNRRSSCYSSSATHTSSATHAGICSSSFTRDPTHGSFFFFTFHGDILQSIFTIPINRMNPRSLRFHPHRKRRVPSIGMQPIPSSTSFVNIRQSTTILLRRSSTTRRRSSTTRCYLRASILRQASHSTWYDLPSIFSSHR